MRIREKKKNKKALSEIVSYTLLMVVVLTLASLVYYWLKVQVPKPTDGCPVDISLVVKDYECFPAKENISITLQNKGYFNIDGFFIRGKAKGDSVAIRELNEVNSEDGDNDNKVWFRGNPGPLVPGESREWNFSYEGFPGGLVEIEIEPVLWPSGGEFVLCDNAIIKKKIQDCAKP